MRSASTAARVAAVVLGVVVFLVAPRAFAKPAPKRIVLYLEVTGGDSAAARARAREALPSDVVLVDTDEFRAALAANGQTVQVGRAYGVPSERAALFHRLHQAAIDIHADGVVVVLVYDTPGLRIERVVALLGNDETPSVDQVVRLDPAKANTDSAKMKAVLAPSLEPFVHPPAVPVSADPEWQGATLPPPRKPSPADRVDPAAPAGAATAAPQNFGEVAVRVWPEAGAPNFVQGRVRLGLTTALAVVPIVGIGAQPKPQNDQAYILGGAVRFSGRTWAIEPGGLTSHFPKSVATYRGQVAVSASFGDRGAGRPAVVMPVVTLQVNRMLWSKNLGPRGSELWAGYAQIDAAIRPIDGLFLAPSGGAFVYDRSLAGAKRDTAAVAYTLAPFPVQGWGGLKLGYEVGHWLPYVGGAMFLYAADAGAGVLVTPFGLRLGIGSNYVDASAGVFLSDSRGTLASHPLDVLPAFNVDVGWGF